LPHHISEHHPQMSMRERAAQFSPFAALSGYDASVNEAGRIVGSRASLSDDAKDSLDRILNVISGENDGSYIIQARFFRKDTHKNGGKYENFSGEVRRVDRYSGKIIFTDGTEIELADLVEAEILEYK